MVDNDKIRTADLASTFSLVVQLRTQKSDLVTPREVESRLPE